MFGIDDMAVAGGLGALANLGGSIMGAGGAAAANAAAQRRNDQQVEMFNRSNDLNQWYFAKNFENNLYMSNTAYQRATADMRAAGINPMLAYIQGGAGGNAGGMQSAASQPHLGDPMPNNPGAEVGRGLGRAVSSAMEAVQTVQSVKNMNEQNELIRAQKENTDARTQVEKAQVGKVLAETGLTKEQILNMPFMRDLYRGQTASAYGTAASGHASAYRDTVEGKITEQFGHNSYGKLADSLLKMLGGLGNHMNAQPQTPPSPSPGRPDWRSPDWKSPNKWWN